MAEVTIEPGWAGPANANIRILDENFSELPANDVHLTMEPPSPGPARIDRAAVRQADGTWAVNGIDLPAPGNWTVRVTIAGNYGTKIVLDGPIVIERAR
jgi:copper transport protein